MNTLSGPRELMEVATQSGYFVFECEPYATDLDYTIAIPTSVQATVRDAGMFRWRDGATNQIGMSVLLDEYGRPLTEDVDNEDQGETKTFNWYYGIDGNFERTIDDGDGELTDTTRSLQPSGTIMFTKNGTIFYLERDLYKGRTILTVRDDDGRQVESATYDNHGKLSSITDGENRRDVRFVYDAHGKLISQVTQNSGSFVGSTSLPMIIEYDHKGNTVEVQGTVGESESVRAETRKYDEQQRPTEINYKSGLFDLGRVAVSIKVAY